MCHLLLALPLLALPIFWIEPLPIAVSIYVPILAFSLWMYWFTMKAMRRPVETGREELLHSKGEVVDASGRPIRVHVHGETWEAVSEDDLHPGCCGLVGSSPRSGNPASPPRKRRMGSTATRLRTTRLPGAEAARISPLGSST